MVVIVTYTTASLTSNCFNKLSLLPCTTGKSLKSTVSAEHIEDYARAAVKEFKSRRYLSILDEQGNRETEQGLRIAANSTEEPSEAMQDVAPLQSTKVHPFIKNWDQVVKG